MTAAAAGSFARSLLRTKPVDRILAEGGEGEGGELKRSLTLLQLTFLSVGAILGTGIFVVLGEAVPPAGPAVVASFVLAAVTALFSALSYAELAGTIPVAGSSYSYAYATLGELVAWVCGWCLLLEYAVSVSAVSVGWGAYLNEFFDGAFGFAIPAAISSPPGEGGDRQHPGRGRGPARRARAAARRVRERHRQHGHGVPQDRRAAVLLRVLRRTRPDLPRGFRVPLFPVTPLLGVAFCVYLMVGLGGVTWVVFALWILVGLAVYFLYGRRRSRLAARSPGAAQVR